MQLSLDAESSQPLVDQIVAGIRARIDDRLLRTGMRVPPIRTFASEHEVSRFTVVEAYDRLVALGYLQSKRGAGFYVAARKNGHLHADNEPSEEIIERAFDNLGVIHQSLDDDETRAKVGVGWLPPEWLDAEGIRRNMRALARRADVRFTSYGTAMGYRPLRDQLQIRLGEMGIITRADQILLTHGATQALDLIARRLLKSGDCVFVDDPGYWNLFANLRLYGLNLVGVPRTADGPDTVALEALLAEHRPRAFFTHSVLHNPTSGNLTPAVAFRVLQLADQYDFTIIEDDTYADFHPGRPTRLAQLDQLQRVIYVGSFSKTLSANLRVGFLAADRDCCASLVDTKIVSSVSSSEFAERLVYLMLTEGHYRKFIERIHGRLALATERCARLLERCNLHIDHEPEGGIFLWAAAPGISDSARLASHSAKSGLMLAPGNIFRPQMQPTPYLRFNVAYAHETAQLESTLKAALDSLGH